MIDAKQLSRERSFRESREGYESIVNLHYKWLILRLVKLSDEYHNRFLPELIHANLIVKLESYYRGVRSHNDMIAHWNSDNAIKSVPPSVHNTLRLFRSGMDLIAEIRKTPNIADHFVDTHKFLLAQFDSGQSRHEELLLLAGTKSDQLMNLETAKEFENADQEERGSIRHLGAQVPDISDIPELIRLDPSQAWKTYFARAKKIGPP